jgi:phosphate transport system ATP-binding protein
MNDTGDNAGTEAAIGTDSPPRSLQFSGVRRERDGHTPRDHVAAEERAIAADFAHAGDGVIQTWKMDVFYGDFRAVADVSMSFAFNEISALIGPSGCGKSTVLRSLNRMNDLIPTARVSGEVRYHGENIYDDGVDPVEIRRRIGMVFQKPNPFPKSIRDNIAWGAKINGFKGSKSDMDDLVRNALEQAALWDEVKDKLNESGLSLSGGQQQRLCIARAIATQPDVVLMDEPCSALDPIATLRIEELMLQLKENYSIIIVTHNMQQAARVSDRTAFFNVELDTKGQRTGYLVEFSPTDELFSTPKEKATEDYITGRFG